MGKHWFAIVRPDGTLAMWKDAMPCLLENEQRAIKLAAALSEKYGERYTARPATLTVQTGEAHE